MPASNIRIVSDNAADRATVSASSVAGALVAANLLTDKKSEVWRSAAGVTTVTLTATWTALETVACVALPFCNLSPTATIRVRGYSDAAGTAQVLDSFVVYACPAPAVKLRGWTATQAASAYANGGGALARVWFTPTPVRCIKVDLVDTANLQGWLEAARLVIANYWSPLKNASGVSQSTVDSTTHYETDAGDLMSEAGTIRAKVVLELGQMAAADRADCADLLRNSKAYPILLSVYPGAADLRLERDYTVYGKRSADSDVALQYAVTYGASIPIVSI